MVKSSSIQEISVIVPDNPFLPDDVRKATHCLTALNVVKLMEWWPGLPHFPHRDPDKVKAIQRSLDWKRVASIAAYLLQQEISEGPTTINKYFRRFYEPTKTDPGREWPPRVPRVVGYQPSVYPTFANVLLHVNGAKIARLSSKASSGRAAKLVFDENDSKLKFAVIDGQHRINGAFLAVSIRNEQRPGTVWEIPAEIFLDLDRREDPPRRQAQIFIDVNFYQKRVDRSLVADLFPTARGSRDPLDDKERAQDIGRRLMLETGPLVGMIQIPGVRFGVSDVVALSTLNGAIEDILPSLVEAGIIGLESQTEFIGQCLDAWLEATGRKQELSQDSKLDSENVVYQGRVLVSFLTLIPACIAQIRESHNHLVSSKAHALLVSWLRKIMQRAGLYENARFLAKKRFKAKGYLGSGGLARFRDVLWAAALSNKSVSRMKEPRLRELAELSRGKIASRLNA